ncbi:hypothetical protein [Algisphaera agarilytica]|uniref:Uncharacterized protein n=1 Tax=Algisphaera agarilytica TaxID=1385975 RepID=A0A7X0H7Z9_9BACT|nr:hypothetical protein [Algisphaera agarilytica]MBB6429504.1 hypothetical protein [Algisphaera agarilytica]
MSRFKPFIPLTIALLGVVVLVVAYGFHQNARDQAGRAERDLDEGMQLVERLRLVRTGVESGGAVEGLAQTGFIPRIEAALNQSELSLSSLRSVTPRLDRSGAVSYRMVLSPVALRPAVEALHALSEGSGQANRVTTLVLRSSDSPVPGSPGVESWRIEAEVLDSSGSQP